MFEILGFFRFCLPSWSSLANGLSSIFPCVLSGSLNLDLYIHGCGIPRLSEQSRFLSTDVGIRYFQGSDFEIAVDLGTAFLGPRICRMRKTFMDVIDRKVVSPAS